ncbi:UvrD-helicase domain-containing protein, partial [Candidatus Woesebacteria bacterium]|nr:UvrD-helicase domain-containing protein [Candidatus Woesebacteria bacterium]
MPKMHKLLAGLNEQQKKAVIYDEGPLLVLAGAGSGKTKCLTYRVAYFISEKGISPEHILLTTFTNKAAGEMKERVAKLTGSAPPFSGTFHSFCAKLLRIDGRAIGIPPGFLIYDESDQKDLVKQILAELNLLPESYSPGGIVHAISEAKNQMLSPTQYAELVEGDWGEVVFKVYLAYEKHLKEIGALDFDDLLIKAVVLLKDNPQILKKWQNLLTHIYVDEWQDTNKIQYALTRLLVGKRKDITAVGDASQSIYGWRGADFRNISYLVRDFPEVKVVNLEQNYRSTQNILAAANSVISKNTSHPVLKLWTLNPLGERIKLYTARNGLDEASFVVNEVLSLTNYGYENKDIAVLYRTNAQSRVLEEALLHEGFPYILVGGIRFYDRKEIKDVLSFLRLLVNSRDSVSTKRIQKLGKRRFEKFMELKKELTDVDKLSTLDLLDTVFEKTDYLALYEKETEENLARLENIKELRSVATEFPNIHDFLENVSLVEAEQDEVGKLTKNGENKKNAVTLMTLHAAKGLEFPIIFIVGMEEGLFPHSRSLFKAEEIEEERRLAYVGMTRAKKLLYLSY